jgi:hypothetical protein
LARARRLGRSFPRWGPSGVRWAVLSFGRGF